MRKNKKRIPKRLIVLAVILAATVLVAPNIPKYTYEKAMDLYNSGHYEESLRYFEITSLLDKDDLDSYYYYTKALNALPMTYNVQKKLFNIATNSKSGAAATLANDKIEKYRYFILTHTGGNYIQQVPYQDKVLHWNPKLFPIKVYIEKSSQVPPYYIDQAQKAFLGWTKVTNNYIKFEFVSSPNNCDIDFRFIENSKSKCKEGDCKYILAYTLPVVSGHKLKKSNIRFSAKDIMGSSFSQEDIYLTSMHEIGHALGIMGHSFYENNLMYPTKIEDMSIHAKYHARGVTAEDLNTLMLLYGMKPDITNGEYTESQMKNLIYPPVVLGSKNEINNKKIEQAKQYIKNAPALPNGYIDLASAYYELGNYQECVKNLYRAFLLTDNEEAKYPILYNLAITYFEARDYNNALNFAQSAANIKNSSEINALIAFLKFKIGNRAFGISELESILAKEPSNIDAAQYLIRAHLENKNRLKAGAVLKEIKASNPDAKSDPRILQFGYLNYFFK